ncbi:MAG: hypothetical protein ACRDPY_37085 [Streptosporangiaceae bacterium]
MVARSEATVIWPSLVTHADWGTDRRKRQVAAARLSRSGGGAHGCYVVESLGPAADNGGFFGQLCEAAAPGQAMIGFDFPLGLPRAYSAVAGIKAFPAFLDELGSPPWQNFHLIAAQPGEISLYRPFYPMRPGSARREYLQKALGLSARDLRRRCEGTDAETLFWTLGGKQVGKGALIGWQLIAAARRAKPAPLLWPFDGSLSELLTGRAQPVVAETYPREYYRYLGPAAVHSRWSKRRKADRLRLIPGVLAWAESLPAEWDASVRRQVESGFSDGRNGEDEFDAAIGLLAMIAVVSGAMDTGIPADDRAVFDTEGWILGRVASAPD